MNWNVLLYYVEYSQAKMHDTDFVLFILSQGACGFTAPAQREGLPHLGWFSLHR